jgi:hypothetical protein
MKEELVVTGKNCPICSQQLPLSEFGVCRARKDGRNLYCKSCIRKKVTDSRRSLKEYRSARKRYVSQPLSDESSLLSDSESFSSANYPRSLRKMTPVERVKDAIKHGAKTQKEIRKRANLSDDEVGDALANLLLWTREIRTHVVDNMRVYFINESSEGIMFHDETPIPARKRDVPSSFSAIEGLMPGKRQEGEEPEKIGGWVAA